MNNQISFGKKTGTIGNVISSVGSSALNVGVTIGAGAGVGACVGKLASLTPYKLSAAAMEHQYADMFVKAVNLPETPEYMKGLSEITSVVSNAKKIGLCENKKARIENIKTLCNKLKDEVKNNADAIKDDGLQKYAKKLLKSKSENSLTADEITGALEGHIKKADKLLEKIDNKISKKTMEDAFGEFAEKAKNCDVTKKLAENGAKHLRKNAVIGAGIAIGVLGALVINLLHTNGLIKLGKRTQKDQPTANMPALPLAKTTQG